MCKDDALTVLVIFAETSIAYECYLCRKSHGDLHRRMPLESQHSNLNITKLTQRYYNYFHQAEEAEPRTWPRSPIDMQVHLRPFATKEAVRLQSVMNHQRLKLAPVVVLCARGTQHSPWASITVTKIPCQACLFFVTARFALGLKKAKELNDMIFEIIIFKVV